MEKPSCQFGKNKARKDGYQHSCFECRKVYLAQHYQKNKLHQRDRIRKSNIKRRRKLKEFILEYLKQHPCVDCGIKDVRVLEFDHLRDKKFNIGDMISGLHGFDSIKKEIEKCEVRCANCHRIKTFAYNNSYRNIVGE